MEKLTEPAARQKQFERDYAHEITILRGVIGAQSIDIKEIKLDVRDIRQRLEIVQEDVNSLKAEVGDMRAEIKDMRAEIRDMREQIKQIITLLTMGKAEL